MLVLAPGSSGPYESGVWQAGPMSAGAELTAVSSSLDELTKRVQRILSELSPQDEERYASDLLELERTLGVANRRLERMVAASR